jgi:hypothetical protein
MKRRLEALRGAAPKTIISRDSYILLNPKAIIYRSSPGIVKLRIKIPVIKAATQEGR